MRSRTVVLSFVIHAGLAVFLLSRAETHQMRRAISVSVPDEAKKKQEEKPRPPPPPKPIVHRPPPKAEPPKVEAPEPVPVAAPKAAAPVETRLALSNADLALGGIALAGTPRLDKKVEPQAKAVRVAQAIPDDIKRRMKEGNAAPAEADCDEEPSKPEPVFQTDIEYTAAAREQGIEGKMKINITVGADGSVTDVTVEDGLDPAFDAAAVAAIKQWRFKPALRCGKPVAGGSFRIVRRFELAN